MHFITTRTHGVLDYLVGALLIALPYIFHFADRSAAQYVPMVLGAFTIVYAFFTNYELGPIRLIPMPVHLAIDVLSGIVLAVSPWVFGFAPFVYLPHLILGISEILIASTTSPRTSIEFVARNAVNNLAGRAR